jgi:hypothetical protein
MAFPAGQFHQQASFHSVHGRGTPVTVGSRNPARLSGRHTTMTACSGDQRVWNKSQIMFEVSFVKIPH